MNDWKELDLTNPPDLTKRYDWQRPYQGGWQDEGDIDNSECISLAMNYHFKFRYREVEDMTLDDLAKEFAYENYPAHDIFCTHIMFAFKTGFRCGRSKDYDDVELDT